MLMLSGRQPYSFTNCLVLCLLHICAEQNDTCPAVMDWVIPHHVPCGLGGQNYCECQTCKHKLNRFCGASKYFKLILL